MTITRLYTLEFRDDRLAEIALEALKGSGWFAGYHGALQEERTFEEHYYDTEDFCLGARGWVCRMVDPLTDGESVFLCAERRFLDESGEPLCFEVSKSPLSRETMKQLLEGHDLSALFQGLTDAGVQGKEVKRLLHLRVHRTTLLVHEDTQPVGMLHLDRLEVLQAGPHRFTGVVAFQLLVAPPPGDDSFPEADLLLNRLHHTFALQPVNPSRLRRFAHLLQKPTPESPRKVILDMDTGVDDALAILLALSSPELQILGITTTGGNIDARQAARNSAAVLRAAHRFSPEVARRYGGSLPPVAPFALGDPACGTACAMQERLSESASRARDASDVHGPDGLGGLSGMEAYVDLFSPGQSPSFTEDALSLFMRLVHEHDPGTVTLITTGPLSNVAHWIAEAPNAVRRLKEIVCMGGVFFECGNRSAVAEFNIHSDPPSAGTVVGFCRRSQPGVVGGSQVPLTFVGLDVTHRVTLRKRVLGRIRAHWERTSRERGVEDTASHLAMVDFVETFTRFYMNFYCRNEGLDGCYLHDPLAVGWVIDPSLCRTESYHVEVETASELTGGMTLADIRPTRIFKDVKQAVTQVCTGVDASRFERLFRERVFGMA